MKPPKFIFQGQKPGKKRDVHGNNDGQHYYYGLDKDGNCWVSLIPWVTGKGLDFDAPKNWHRNGENEEEVMTVSKDEIKKKFDPWSFLNNRTHNSASEYVTAHTGGSIRHAGIRVMDVMEMIHDYKKDAVRALEDAYALGVLHESKRKAKAKAKAKKVPKLSRKPN